MSRGRGGVVWFCLRGSLRARRSGYLGLALIVGLIGGVSMASIAAARRTQSSYPAYLASTNPSDLNLGVYAPNGQPISAAASRHLTAAIKRMPGVTSLRTDVSLYLAPLGANGAAQQLNNLNLVVAVGSLNGLDTAQDRLTAVAGRLADPTKPNQIELSPSAARLLRMHVGERVRFGLYGGNAISEPGFGTPRVQPTLVVHATVVGLVDLNTQIVQDDVDRAYGFAFVTPALLKEAIHLGATTTVGPSSAEPVLYGIQVRGGAAGVPALEQRIVQQIPPRATYAVHVTSHTQSQVELALRPESLALGGFGVIAALVCLILAILAVGRQVRSGEEERQVLRSLGAGPFATAAEGLAGIMLAIVLGTVLALALAVALSPLAPIGPVRAVYPFRGVSLDWTVLGFGVAALLGGLGLASAVAVWRAAPPRAKQRVGQPLVISRLVGRAEAAGLPTTAVVGTRFALESGRGRTSAPVRSAIVGSVVAILTVVMTLTFASSLSHLVATPSLYGWNWTYALNPSQDVPVSTLSLLAHDRDVAAYTGVQYVVISLDGQQVPVIITLPNKVGPTSTGGLDPAVSPPILFGRGLVRAHDIVVGAATLAALHKHVGQWLTLTYGNPTDGPLYVAPTRFHIVGTTTLPAVGFSSFVQDHTSMGDGAMFAFAALPRRFQQELSDPDPNLDGPGLVFVRMRTGVSATGARANLEKIAAAGTRALEADPRSRGNSVSVLGVERPVQIVNYRSIGSTPVVLAIGLAVGAVVALGFTLNASVRRRRRDLALLKALGFTPRQLAGAVAWQGTVAAVVGVLVGIPLGIVAGRLLWDDFARTLNAVPNPTIPALSIALVGVGALLFANLVAALPGRRAALTPSANLLNSE
ncbi:MAG: FtsX-like permease family protein [Acidimicrobiales bacterium]